jgi:hypothetical protein
LAGLEWYIECWKLWLYCYFDYSESCDFCAYLI